MNPLDDLLRCKPKPPRTCQTNLGGGEKCGQPAVAAIGGVPVCAECEEAASPAVDYINRILRGRP
jgi:hypothetical protein